MTSMKLKRFIAGLMACCFLLSGTLTAYADDVNIDNIIHDWEGRVGRYRYSGQQWGWIVEVYVATTDTGKLDQTRTLTDPSNAAYLGRVAFVENYTEGRFPALQRPIAIQTNGGGSLPQLGSCSYLDGAKGLGFPDPTVTGASVMIPMFQTTSDALQYTWTALESQNGGTAGLLQKILNVTSKSVNDKVKAIGEAGILRPGNTIGDCPVEYAFVLTPLEYLLVDASMYSPINWSEQFWMGANEGAVLNRSSIIKAQTELQRFYANTAGSALVGTPLYLAAEAKLKLACTIGELSDFKNLSHRDLPDSAFLDHNQFGISTPNRNA